MNKKEKFIETYENKIKKIRKHYYKNKVIEGLEDKKYNQYISFVNFVPLVLSILVILIGGVNNTSMIIALILLIVAIIILSIIKKVYKLYESSYELEIKKYGYFSIDKYEKDIKKYITGPNGYYKELLQKYIKDYKITKEDTYTIEDTRGNECILHNNKDKDEIYIINNNLKEIPKVIKLKYSNIRYYREDTTNNRLLLKTDLDELYYDLDSKVAFDKIIKSKYINNEPDYNPENYINDFERYINRIKNKDIRSNDTNIDLKRDSLRKTFLLVILAILFIVLVYFIDDYQLIFAILFIITLVGISMYLTRYLSIKNVYIKTDNEYLEYLNKDKDCQDKFKELKLALRIPKEVEKIYSDEGAEFLCWDNGGYFHLFLNVIYFNVIYISVKIKDIEYYKVEDKHCTIKLKDKEYSFDEEAKKTFDKLLPNKDYDWIHGIINKEDK